jgi:hypothetical protein
VRSTALCSVALVLAAGCVLGAPTAAADTVVNEKALPKGMTVEQARSAVRAAKVVVAADAAKRSAEERRRIDAVLREFDPLRTRMQSLAKSDAEYGTFLGKAHALLGDASKRSRYAALNDFFGKGRATVERTYRAAGGNPGNDHLVLQRSYRQLVPVRDGILTYYLPKRAPPRSTIASTIRFTAPYAIHDTDTERGGPGFTHVTTSVANDDAKMQLSAEATSVGLVTSCEADATAGVFIDVPAGKRNLKVRVLYEYDFRGGVWAALGMGKASMDGRIVVADTESNAVTAIESLGFEDALAVVAWYAEVTNDATGFTEISGPVVPGHRHIVLFGIRASALGVGGGGGGSFVTLTPTAMEVEFLD